MRRRLLILALSAAALAAPAQSVAAERALLPSPLAARFLAQHGAPVKPAPRFRTGFVVEGSNGYKVGVHTFGAAVVLEVWRGRKGQRTSTAYLARGVATRERLQATFGQFGKISMRFRESRNRTWRGKRRSCRGAGRFVKRRGVFVGNLRFRGEGGYVSVRVRRAKGAVVSEAEKCRGQRRSPSLAGLGFLLFDLESALLALAHDGVDSTAFISLEDRRGTFSLVFDEESRGKLAIVRTGVVRSQRPVRVNEALTSARLSPPPPFHGTGRYRAFPDGTTTWSGDLSVNFPGAPRFPLTGPEFEETLIELPF
jgi:hypothetical protein